jgi:hypothetical protein
MRALLELPVPVSFLIVILLSILLSVIGLKLVRKKFSPEILKEQHEVAGFIFNAFGLIYAVLVAFVVFATWTDYNEARVNTELEANKIADLFLDAQAFPDSIRTVMQQAAVNYARIVYDEEWDYMDRAERNPAALKALEKLWTVYSKIDYDKLTNKSMYEESLRRLNDLGEYRRLRVLSAENNIPSVIWAVLLIGGITSVCYTYFFGTKNLKAQYMMTAALAVTNALILFLIYILDHPFAGASGITKEPFEMILEMFRNVK